MFRTKWFLAVVCLSLFCAFLVAQEYRATITGRVVDTSSAVVPNVKIVATHTATQTKTETISSAEGQYSLPFLTPGIYSISAEAQGFKRYLRDGVDVGTNQRIGLDIELAIGAVTESVTITAEVPLLQTATASTGQVINSRQIANLPMNGRTALSLAQLAYGVTPNSDPRFNRPFDNAGPSDFSMGGAPTRTNELLIDGAPDATRDNRVAYNPPVDAVEEVKVESFQADAAYGHTGGGTANVVLKGGGNAFHGSIYEFNQVSRLAATPFFINKAGQKKSVTRFNQYGVTASGPVIVPKLFNGRDKLFFFFSWEGIRDSFPEPLTSTVPTDRQRNGDFSQLLALSPNYQLYDPLTGVREGSRVRRTAFQGNIIPAARLNSIAKSLLTYYPAPNQPGGSDGQNNHLSPSVRSDTYDGYLGRLDVNFSPRHKLFWNYRLNSRIENRSNRFFNIATGNFLGRDNWGSTLDDVITLSPTMVLNTRLNWTRFTESNTRTSNGFDFTTLGFPAALKAASAKLVLPVIDMNQFTDIGTDGGNTTPYDTFQIFSTVTKIMNKHSFKTGVDLRMAREYSYGYGNSSGSYQFRENWTRGPLDNSPNAPLGQDLASLLLGLPTAGSFDLAASRAQQANYFSLFVHDDWRVTPNLTLNMGVRYERDLPTTERYNRMVNGFDGTTASPISAAAIAAYARSPIPELAASAFRVNGGLVFAGQNGRDLYSTNGYFSPRLGFAWKPDMMGSKTVLRGGVGLFFFPIGVVAANNYQEGFSQTTTFVPTLDSFLTPNDTLSNPFRAGILQPTGSAAGLSTFLGQTARIVNSNPLNPYSLRWSFTVQRELPGNIVVETGYQGNHAVHLPVDYEQFNFIPRQFLSTSPIRDAAMTATNSQLTGSVTNPFLNLIPGTTLNGSTVARSQLLRPFPQFTTVRIDGMSQGSSYYHMWETRIEKRFSHGLSFLANYQWSRLIEKRSRLNDSDVGNLEKRVAGEDRPQRFVINASYDLPFGRGRTWGSNASKIANIFIGGWNMNAIYYLQSGTPLTWGNIVYFGGELNPDTHNVDRAFDTTPFYFRTDAAGATMTAAQQRADARIQLVSNYRTFPSRFSDLRQDRVNSMDFSVIKNTHITERINLQFRAEFFNFFNHPIHNAPNLTPTSSDFGRITGQSNLSRITQLGLRLTW